MPALWEAALRRSFIDFKYMRYVSKDVIIFCGRGLYDARHLNSVLVLIGEVNSIQRKARLG